MMRILDRPYVRCRPGRRRVPPPPAPGRRDARTPRQRQDPWHGVPRARGRAPARAPRRGGAGARDQGESERPRPGGGYRPACRAVCGGRHRHRRLRELLVGQCARRHHPRETRDPSRRRRDGAVRADGGRLGRAQRHARLPVRGRPAPLRESRRGSRAVASGRRSCEDRATPAGRSGRAMSRAWRQCPATAADAGGYSFALRRPGPDVATGGLARSPSCA